MRFDYTTPVDETKTVNALIISTYSVDLERSEAHVSYQLGNWNGSAFTVLFNDQMVTVPEAQFASVFTLADQLQTNNPGTPVQDAIEYALYKKLEQFLGLTGTIDIS